MRVAKVIRLWAVFSAALWGPAQAAPVSPFQTVIEDFARANTAVPGVAATVISPRAGIDWSGATGLANTEKKIPLRPDDAVHIASVTKLFVAAASLRLAEDNKLDLGAPISTYIDPRTDEQLRAGGYDPKLIQTRHLLSHTSGLFDYAASPAFLAALTTDPGHKWSRREQIQLAMDNGKPLGKPGDIFGYSDTGYIILGEIIERITHKPLSQAVRELVDYKRLHLDSTWWEDGLDRAPKPHPEASFYFGPIDATSINASWDLFGGGGLLSTTRDLARFVRAAGVNNLFSRPGTLVAALGVPPARRDAHDPVYALMGTTISIGSERCWGHTGFFGTYAFHCPISDVTYVIHFGLGGVPVPVKPLVDALAAAASAKVR